MSLLNEIFEMNCILLIINKIAYSILISQIECQKINSDLKYSMSAR
jgi:hypothetical protein